jgi:hypothetical protein
MPDQPQPAATEAAMILVDETRLTTLISELVYQQGKLNQSESIGKATGIVHRLNAAPPSGQVVVSEQLIMEAAEYIVPRGKAGHRIKAELRAALNGADR